MPHPVKVERMERLVEAVQRRARERAERFVGRTVEVLVEGPSRTDPERLRGRTRHNKVVNFTGLAAPGELTQVRIDSATSQTLSGEERLLAGRPARAEHGRSARRSRPARLATHRSGRSGSIVSAGCYANMRSCAGRNLTLSRS